MVDQLDRGEVLHPEPDSDRGASEPDEVVVLIGPGGADEAQVVGPADPVEG